LCGDEELIEFVALNDAKSKGLATRTHYSHIRKSCLKPVSETLQCTKPGEFRRHNLRMRIMPAVAPDVCQVTDLNFFGGSHIHCIPDIALSTGGYVGCFARVLNFDDLPPVIGLAAVETDEVIDLRQLPGQ